MKFLHSKFFISFLLITVAIYSFWVYEAEAGFFKKVFRAINKAIDDVFRAINVAINTVVIPVLVYASCAYGCVGFLIYDSPNLQCRQKRSTEDPTTIGNYDKYCNPIYGAGYELTYADIPPDIDETGCIYKIPTKFYIPEYNNPKLIYSTYDENGNWTGDFELPANTQRYRSCTNQIASSRGSYAKLTQIDPETGLLITQCVKLRYCGPADESKNEVSIYRFNTPAQNESNTVANLIFETKNKIGNGYIDVQKNGYHIAGDTKPMTILPYSSFCSGNICQLTDLTVPENSYIWYASKISGDYNSLENNKCVTKPHKFLNKDNVSNVIFPTGAQNLTTQNAYNGIFKTPACQKSPTSTPSLVFQAPKIVEYPSPIQLAWISMNTKSCVASGEWSGNKAVSGRENISKPKGVYNFSLSCTGAKGSVSKNLTVSVLKVPKCDFTASPSTITPPEISELCWNCLYSDGSNSAFSCSIDQGIGSIDPSSGCKEIRPTENTTFTLTCDGIDGSKSFRRTVGIGGLHGYGSTTIEIKEVIPR